MAKKRKHRQPQRTPEQRAKDSPRLGELNALREIRRELKRGHRHDRAMPATSQGQHTQDERTGSGTTANRGEDEDDALFRREMRGVRSLRRQHERVALEPPKPAPVPRQPPSPQARDPAQSQGSAARDDVALFRMMMADVEPLTAHNQADIQATRPTPNLRDEQDKPDPAATATSLPDNADELSASELFQMAMRDSQPLSAQDRVTLDRPPPPPKPLKRREDDASVLRESMESPLTLEDRLDSGEETAFMRNGLPRKVLSDLRRGRWSLQAEVDLHGLTRDEARAALSAFLLQSLQRGHRCVRVIHGKGLGSPGRVSILKQLSRGWLAQREEILAFCQANPNQGGSGALMVLLRAQNRKRP